MFYTIVFWQWKTELLCSVCQYLILKNIQKIYWKILNNNETINIEYIFFVNNWVIFNFVPFVIFSTPGGIAPSKKSNQNRAPRDATHKTHGTFRDDKKKKREKTPTSTIRPRSLGGGHAGLHRYLELPKKQVSYMVSVRERWNGRRAGQALVPNCRCIAVWTLSKRPPTTSAARAGLRDVGPSRLGN